MAGCNIAGAASGSTLETLLKSTLQNNGQIKEAQGDIEMARAQLEQAKAALFPKANALFLAAPIFEERGNATSSSANYSKWGALLKGAVEIAQPLYTFGQISSYTSAAENQILANTELAEIKRHAMIALTKEFYYGAQMAGDLDGLVDDLTKFLEEAVETADKNLKRKTSNTKPHDVYKLKTALEDLRQKKLHTVQARQTAARAVAWVSGDQSTISAPSLSAENYEMKSLDDYLKLSRARRPEFRAIDAGQTARQALRDAKRAQSYPVVFVGALATYGYTALRDKQPSIYAYDPFNRLEGGVGIGLKFDLEFKRHSAEAAEQQAQYMKLKATESYAVSGIELQVQRTFWELEQAAKGLEVASRRKTLAKKWFISNAMGWSIGVTPAKDLLESLEGDGLAKKNYIETVYALNMSLAKLSQAVGEEVTHLKYK